MLSLDVIRSSSPRNISCWEELEKGPPGEDNIPDDQHKASIRTPELSHRGLTPFGEASFKKYRCTTGGHLPRARSETKVAFRRHEKEHVDRYYCFSEDSMPYEDAPTGRRCAICKLQDPDQLHFNQHRLQSCLDRKEPKYFTRKDLFRKHLKDDHTLSPQIIDSLPKHNFALCR